MTSTETLYSGQSEDTSGIAEIVVPDLRPMELRLTMRAFFRLFEVFVDNNGSPVTMEEAYEKLVEKCIQSKLALNYSDFLSFKRSYYSQIHSQRKSAK